jgi:acyl-CoA reductase-like NAD-dependent aldehyde dehydrogenase
VAFTGDVVIIATTEALARELMKSAQADAKDAGQSGVNAAISLHAQALHDVLADNRQHLVAQNMLEQGHSKEEAERHVAALLAIIDIFRDGGAKLDVSDKRIQFELSVRLKPIE